MNLPEAFMDVAYPDPSTTYDEVRVACWCRRWLESKGSANASLPSNGLTMLHLLQWQQMWSSCICCCSPAQTLVSALAWITAGRQ